MTISTPLTNLKAEKDDPQWDVFDIKITGTANDALSAERRSRILTQGHAGRRIRARRC